MSVLMYQDEYVILSNLVTAVQTYALPIRSEVLFFFFQAEDGIRDKLVTGVQTCALPIFASDRAPRRGSRSSRGSRRRSGAARGRRRAGRRRRRRARRSRDPPAPDAVDERQGLARALGDLRVPLHDLVARRFAVDGVFEVRHRHAEQLQDPSRFLARHLFAPSMLAQSRRSSGTSRQRGSPSGLKFLVVTKCIPWWRFSLNFPPPYRAAIHPAGSSRNGAISVAARRTSHLNRIVPANGSWTPRVAVNPGQTRANSSRVCRRDGRPTPRLIRVRLRDGSIPAQHH